MTLLFCFIVVVGRGGCVGGGDLGLLGGGGGGGGGRREGLATRDARAVAGEDEQPSRGFEKEIHSQRGPVK